MAKYEPVSNSGASSFPPNLMCPYFTATKIRKKKKKARTPIKSQVKFNVTVLRQLESCSLEPPGSTVILCKKKNRNQNHKDTENNGGNNRKQIWVGDNARTPYLHKLSVKEMIQLTHAPHAESPENDDGDPTDYRIVRTNIGKEGEIVLHFSHGE